MQKVKRILKVHAFKGTYFDYLFSWLGGFLGIALLGWINSTIFSSYEAAMLIGSFGASAILIFGEYKSPFSQPRNLVGGHVISALVGVTVMLTFNTELWLTAAFAVSLALLAMKLTDTIHPPGGATALIAVIGGEKIVNMGYWYVVFPVTTGALFLLLIACFTNNIRGRKKDRYPKSWF